jgi:hypothetical protein
MKQKMNEMHRNQAAAREQEQYSKPAESKKTTSPEEYIEYEEIKP